jgi:hypothetical protein
MKGIVVEIHNRTAAVLSENGSVVRVPNKGYCIGQEVISIKKQIKTKTVIAFASAAAGLLLVLGLSTYFYFTPYTYVSLDVNPSIEYSVNRFDRVLSAHGVNDDGTAILNEKNLQKIKYSTIEDAVAKTIDEISENGYFDSNAGGIVVTTSSDNMTKAKSLVKTLNQVANQGLEKNNCDAVVITEAVGADRVEEAEALGVTPGKLNLVEKLMEAAGTDTSVDMTEWLNRSVKDILAQTNTYREEQREQKKNADDTTQNKESNQNAKANGETSDGTSSNGNSAVSDGVSGAGNGSSNGNGGVSESSNGSGNSKGTTSGSNNNSDTNGSGNGKGSGNGSVNSNKN